MMYGYARVSDVSQNERSQVEKLQQFGCDEILMEKVTGVAEDRQLVRLIQETLKPGDMLVVMDVSRFGRSAVQSILLAEQLKEKDVNLVIMDLGVDTRTPAGEMVFGIMCQLAQFERKQTKERQKRGIELAKKEGRHLGRKAKWTKKSFTLAVQAYLQGETVDSICTGYNIPRSTFYKFLKEEGIRR